MGVFSKRDSYKDYDSFLLGFFFFFFVLIHVCHYYPAWLGLEIRQPYSTLFKLVVFIIPFCIRRFLLVSFFTYHVVSL